VATNRVRVIDKGYKALRARLAKAAKHPVTMTVGVHADAGSYPNGTAVVRVAEGKEFGFFQPQKSFVRPVFDAAQGQHRPTLQIIARQVITGTGSVKVGLRKYGNVLAKLMRREAPKKTGRLRRSIKVKVA